MDGSPQFQTSCRTQREPPLAAVLIVAFAHVYPLKPVPSFTGAVSRPVALSDPKALADPFFNPASLLASTTSNSANLPGATATCTT